MINYFAEAEKTLRARGYLDSALSNLERRRDRIIARNKRYKALKDYIEPSAPAPKKSSANCATALLRKS